MNLTPKQEKFCQEYVKTGNKSEAYKAAYDVSGMKPETINRCAFELYENHKVTARIEELKGMMEKKFMYSLSESVRKDLKLIERYEVALEILENMDASDEEVKVAQRVIRHIGAAGYSSAQERLSKQGGFFDKDNKQKITPVQPIEFRIIGKDENE